MRLLHALAALLAAGSASAADFSTSSKSADRATAAPGDTLTFTLKIINTGPSSQPTVQDNLPAGVTYTPGSTIITVLGFPIPFPDNGGQSPLAGGGFQLPFGIGNNAFTAEVDLQLKATVNASAVGGQICNVAQISSPDLATPAVIANLPCVQIPGAKPDLSGATLALQAAPRYRPGDTVHYTLTLPNTGAGPAQSVMVAIPIDPNLTPVLPIPGGGTVSAGQIVWTLASLAANGAPAVFRWDATVNKPLPNGTVVSEQGTITAQNLAQPQLTDDPSTAPRGDPTSFKVTSAPDLSSSTKSFANQTRSDGTNHPGDSIQFTIQPDNTGDAETTTTLVTDKLDANLVFVSAGQGGNYDGPTRTVRWTLPRLPVGMGPALTFVATIQKPLANGTRIFNQGTFSAPELPASGQFTNSVSITVTSAPDLSGITKTIVPQPAGPVAPGTTLTYAIRVPNTGDTAATQVSVSDAIDASFDQVTPLDGGTLAANTIKWSLGTLQSGDIGVVRFTARVKPLTANGTVISNQASVSAAELAQPVLSDDPNTPAPHDPTLVTVMSAPDLSTSTKAAVVQGQVTPGLLRPGDTVQYTLRIANTGSTYANHIVVTDAIDALLTNVSPDAGGRLSGSSLRWDSTTVPQLARLAPGDPPVQLTFTAQVAAGAHDGDVIVNQGQLTSDEGLSFVTDDPSTPAPRDATRLRVSFPDLRAAKSVIAVSPRPDGTIHPGDLVDYSIALTNRGTFAATHLAVQDAVDPSLDTVQPGQGGTLANGQLTWTEATTPALAQLAPGATLALTFRARVAPATRDGTVVTNQAVVRASELAQPVSSNAVAFTVHAAPDLRATTKTVQDLSRADGTFREGDQVQYTIKVQNSGDEAATHVVVTDAIDPALDVPVTGGSIRWDEATVPALAKVAPGDAVTLTFTGRISTRAIDGQQIANQAVLAFAELPGGTQRSDDPSTPALGDPTLFTVIAGPRLGRSTKRVADVTTPGGPVRPGDVLEYSIDVVNDGSEVSINTTLTDAPPPLTTYVPGSTRLNGQLLADPAGRSALENGLRVRSQRSGTPDGNVLLTDPAAADTAAHVSFRVRVADNAVAGQLIANQGLLRAVKVPQAVTDDPTTQAPGDATVVVVGQAPRITALKTWRLVTDLGVPGQVDPGDTIEYRIDVANSGTAAAQGVQLTDTLPSGATYLAGTRVCDGRELPDDAGARTQLAYSVPTLAAGQRFSCTVQLIVPAVSSLSNQGQVTWTQGSVLTDGDPTLPGEQPTITPVGPPAANLSCSAKAVVDVNGGDVQPGDELLYTVTLVNSGAADLAAAELTDPLPAGLRLVAGSAVGDGTITIAGNSLRVTAIPVRGNGGRAQVQFRATVAPGVLPGTVITNVASVRASPAPGVDPLPLPPVSVVVGQAQGAAGLAGTVRQSLGTVAGAAVTVRPLAGFQVLLRRAGAPDGPPIKTALTDAAGAWRMLDLPPATYALEVLSPEGAHFADGPDTPLQAGQIAARDISITSSGEVYRSDDKQPVQGARAVLLYDDAEVGSPPPACEADRSPIALGSQPLLGGRVLPRAVGAGCLRAGQQGQQTGALGLYRFDLRFNADGTHPVRKYRLEIGPGSPALSYPGSAPAPLDGYGSAAPVVDGAVIEAVQNPRWFARFQLSPGEGPNNNLVPLDPTRLRLAKVASRASASAGEVVSYTVTLQNPSSADVRVDPATGLGGIHIADALPADLHYLAGSARAVRLAGTATRLCARVDHEAEGPGCAAGQAKPLAPLAGKLGATSGSLLDFGPYDLRAGETLQVRYAAMVGTQARPGDAVNRAVARAGDVDVSNSDSATVRIAQDPLFDLAGLIGQVRCETGHEPLPSVKIYEDEGYAAQTDDTGKFHFHGLQPGLHRFKIDARTLPPGSEPVGDGSITIYLTRGLDARRELDVVCRSAAVGPDKVALKARPPPPPKPAPPLSVEGDARNLEVTVDGVALQPPRGDAELLQGVVVDGGKVVQPARLRTLLATGRAPAAWRLAVEDEKGAAVGELKGDGLPPEELQWPPPDGPELRAGQALRYRLWLEAGPLRFAAAPRPLPVAAPPEPPKVVQEWLLRGELFTEGSAEATKELSRQLAAAEALLRDEPELRAQLEVHVGLEGTAREAQALSDDRAEAVRAALAAAGVANERIEARGRGADEPLQPNATESGRRQNRRVVLRAVLLPPRAAQPEPELPTPPRALLQGAERALDAQGRFKADVPSGTAEVAVELGREDGAQLFARVAPARIAASPEGKLPVTLEPQQGRGRVGQVDVALPLFAAQLSVEAERGDPGTVLLDGRGRPRGLQLLLRARSLDAADWSVAVADAAGKPVWQTSGRGPPPPRLRWPGDVALSAGPHEAQLTVRDQLGGEAQSAPARFLALGERAPLLRRQIQADQLFLGKSARLRGDARKQLDALAQELQAAGSIRVEVFGDDGPDSQRLAEERAQAMLQVLTKRGIAAERVLVRGRGDAQPLAPNATAGGRRRNNRVLVQLFAPPSLKEAPPPELPGPCGAAEPLSLEPAGCKFTGELPQPIMLSVKLLNGPAVSMRVPAPPALDASPRSNIIVGAAQAGGESASVLDANSPPPLPSIDAPAAGGEPQADSRKAPAAELSVALPPAGAIVRSEWLWLSGNTRPGNKLSINGKPIELDAAGHFTLRLPLARGTQKLSIVSTDTEGNTALIERELNVNPDGLFVMALAEGDLGQGGAQLAGAGDRTDFGNVFAKGRASGFVDGRWDASQKLGGFFNEVHLIGNLDTSRRSSDAYFRELIDPAKFYPIEGDSGSFTQEAASHLPIYLKLTADQSRLIAGDFKTQLQSSAEQLFRYDRTLSGVDLDFAKSIGPLESRLSGFVAQGDVRVRHAHAELRGTGGSVFYLRHPDIVEGSEQVRMIVRDGSTGIELLRTERQRDVDYTLRAAEGRLLFKQPVPSTAEASFLTNANYTNPLAGNPVWIVIDYEYRGRPDDGGGAGGAHLQETLGMFTAGGGLINEDHAAGQAYQLYGLNLGIRPKPRTFATLELAKSKGTDAEGYASVDGGMTFGSLGANCLDRGGDLYACLAEGRALRLEAGAELADWIDRPAGTELLRGNAYFDVRERGFYANGSVADQGTKKAGLLLKFTPDKLTQLTARFDSVAADVAQAFDPQAGFSTKRVIRRFTGLQIQRALNESLTLTGELTDVNTDDARLGTTVTDLALVGLSWKATPRLTLALNQEIAFRADVNYYPDTTDRLATTASATFKLSEQLYAQGSETVRWNGSNATLVGLRTPLPGLAGSAYANERFALRSGQLFSTSVLGAEERIGNTRTYGEYQLDSIASGGQQRAVLGLNNRYELRPGLFAGFAYERAQVLGGIGALGGGLIPGAAPGATLGGINGVSPTASPSLNPVANCIPGSQSCTPQSGLGFNPAGGFFPGTTARDAISLSLEAVGSDRFKASGKAELRKDKADARLIGQAGVADRLQLVVLGDATYKSSDDLGFFGRLNWAESRATDLGQPSQTRIEARWLELTFGLALRPVHDDRFALLLKLSRIYDQRPVDLTSGIGDAQISDVAAVSPTFELPFGFALAEKVAYKHTRAILADGPFIDTHLWLWVNRLDYHLKTMLDLSGEYRQYLLRGPSAGGTGVGGDGERGFLIEAAFKPNRYSRLGIGYNFTAFSDDELQRLDHSAGGFFVRAVGQY